MYTGNYAKERAEILRNRRIGYFGVIVVVTAISLIFTGIISDLANNF
jgi:cobalamin synthase